ncbi:sigma factor-like helix-turn-helix DNA-binding protein [Vitreimonas flagellata]|uniref:sigma-70 region 4 domain-containing protein n=1 Tax=Vitreimonas flagellata TaxID=2560861 RepID=UPI003B82CDD0
MWFKLKGFSHADIAKRLGVSRHTVPHYLSRGLAKIAAARAAFEAQGGAKDATSASAAKTS